MRKIFPALASALVLVALPAFASPVPPPALGALERVPTPRSQELNPGCAAPAGWGPVRDAVERSRERDRPAVSVAVACRGEITFNAGFGGAHADTVFRLGSITKTLTAATLLRLVEIGSMRLDDRLSYYLYGQPRADKVTVGQLLTHTAGVPDFTEDASYPAHKTRPHTTADMLAWIGALQPEFRFKPGEGWAYSNSGYVLLGAAMERRSGQSLGELYRSYLFSRVNAPSLAFDIPGEPLASRRRPELARGYKRGPEGSAVAADPIDMSIPGAAGALRGTAEDLATLLDALFGGRILSEDSLRLMTSPGLLADGRPNRWGMPAEWREGLQADYGLGVFIDERTGRRRVWHAGDIDGFHTWFAHFPDEGVTIVILRNSESGNPMEDEIQAAVFKALGR